MVAIRYQNSPSSGPAYDHARRDAAVSGVPVDRKSSNSETVSHIQHGAGVNAGGNWQAHKASYDRYTTPEQKARDKELLSAAERSIARTWDPQSAKHLMMWLGQHHSFNPHAIEMMRGIGTKEQEYEKARGAARDAEKQAGRTPKPPSPEHEKGATTDVTRGSLSRLKKFYNRDNAA
jgi:hypothetical protein